MTPQKKRYLGWALVLLLCFWLGNHMGAIYTAASGNLTEKLLSALDIEKLLTPPLGLHLSPVFLLWGLCAAAVAGVVILWIEASRHKTMPGKEHGSARWGTPEDIKPFIAPEFENNVILTETERLSMAGRMKYTLDDDYNRNKNVMVIGGSGSRKTRGVIKPNLLQMNCNYVITSGLKKKSWLSSLPSLLMTSLWEA